MLQSILREDRTDIPGLEDLLSSGISFVIVGAIARNVYCNRPRNTQDIDVLTRNYQQLATYIHQKHPNLEMTQNETVIKFKHNNKEIIDIMIPYNEFFEAILDNSVHVGRFTVASPEALVAMKFAAIMAKHRSLENKYQDRGDIASIMIKTHINIEKIKQHLTRLYPQAPDDFGAFITRLKQEFNV
jgi:hypothetical protein